ncbi:MAG: (Fe-S)-binding protein [Chlorobi bacterium]|nr:(Fe-S)-binding protein [Chlorobiota bacterium]
MTVHQIVFILVLGLTFAIFGYTVNRLAAYFRITRPAFPVRDIGRRILVTLQVAIGQSKILRRPVIGLIHALVFWGFIIILFGSLEMIVDGVVGTEKAFHSLGKVYDVIMGSGDIFALIIAVSILIFLSRRLFFHVRRFAGREMTHKSHVDANIALSLILLLMITLLGMNTFYVAFAGQAGHHIYGVYPVSTAWFAPLLSGSLSDHSLYFWFRVNWWMHILTIFFFANYLPYSKHFHVFLSVPNVFLSRLRPIGKLPLMENILREVKMMLDPSAVADTPETEDQERFGIMDVEDVTWKNYLDSLTCTQCGRCTSVCPANITGKLLSPRKIMMDTRQRMKDKGPGMVKNGKEYSDEKSLLRDYISEEEIWACTMCNACVQECPLNINQPEIILGMRRYLVMEEAAAPGELNTIFSNIENNGAPWQFSQDDRLNWAKELYMED